VPADQLRCLEAVHVGHIDIEQDHGELALEQLAERIGARMHADYIRLEFG
jgi:hypothetical protein